MALYLKMDSMNGSVKAQGFDDQIMLNTMQWSTYRMLNLVVGREDDRLKAGVSVPSVTLTQELDDSTHSMLSAIWKGDEAKKATITRYAGVSKKSGTELREYTLENALISYLDIQTTANGNPTVKYTITFTKMEVKDYDQSEKGKKGSNKSVNYDLTKSKGG